MQRPGLFSQPMRRLLLAALVWIGAAVPGVALAQFACNGAVEGFEASVPPTGWSVATNEPGGPQWTTIAGSGEAGNYTNGSGGAASVSSDAFGSAEFDTSLVTPAFSLVGFVTAQVDYTVNYQNFAGRDFLDLDISTDGGATWATLLSWNEDHGAFRTPPGEDVTVDLAAYAGQANLQLRWRYYDPNSGDYDWYAQIDDVALVCTGGATPAIGVTPPSLAASQATNLTTTQTLNIANTGGGTLNWDIDEEQTVRSAAPPAGGNSPNKLGAPAQAHYSVEQLAKLNEAYLVEVLADGSFEAGTPSPFWSEASTNFGTTLCTVAACGTGTGTGPRTGLWWSWFGGIAAYEAGSLSQSVTIPSGGPATLTFWVEQFACSGDPADYLEATMDGTQLWVTNATDPACGVLGYRQITVDVSAYADGGSHMLEFNSEIFGTAGQGSNFFLDDVSLDTGAPVPCSPPSDIPWLSLDATSGSNAGGTDTDVTATFDSTGYGVGVYTGNLCVTSNDPATPLVVVPVELTVVAAPPNIDVAPLSMAASQAPNVTTSQTLVIDNTGGTALNWSVDEEPGSGTCVSPASVPWLNFTPASGTTAAGGSSNVTVGFDSTGLTAGTYNASLCVSSDDPDAGPGNGTDLVVVPVALTVVAPDINVSPLSMATTQAPDTTTSQTLMIGNTGTAALNWSIDEEPGSGTCVSPASVPWLNFTPASGTTAASGSSNVTVGFDSTGLTAGTYNASLCVSSDDPDAGPGNGTDLVVVPIALTVVAPDVDIGVGSLAATLAQNATTNQTLVIDNTGTAALNWVIDEEPGSGTCVSPASVAWLSFTPASGTTAAGGSSNVTIGFDSTGLTAGTYNANLCISSDDPDPGPGNGTNLVVVPVALTVLTAPPRLVPTFGPFGGTLLGLLLAGFGLVMLRRRAG